MRVVNILSICAAEASTRVVNNQLSKKLEEKTLLLRSEEGESNTNCTVNESYLENPAAEVVRRNFKLNKRRDW